MWQINTNVQQAATVGLNVATSPGTSLAPWPNDVRQWRELHKNIGTVMLSRETIMLDQVRYILLHGNFYI